MLYARHSTNVVGTQRELTGSLCSQGDTGICRNEPLMLCGNSTFPCSILCSMLLDDFIFCTLFLNFPKLLHHPYSQKMILLPISLRELSDRKRTSTCSDYQGHPLPIG